MDLLGIRLQTKRAIEVTTHTIFNSTSLTMTNALPITHWDGPNSAGVGPRALGCEKVGRFAKCAIDKFRPHGWTGTTHHDYNSTSITTFSSTSVPSSTTTAVPDLCLNPKGMDRLLCGTTDATVGFFLAGSFVMVFFGFLCCLILHPHFKQGSKEDGMNSIEKVFEKTEPSRYRSTSKARLREKVRSARPSAPVSKNAWQGLEEGQNVQEYKPPEWRSVRYPESRAKYDGVRVKELPKTLNYRPVGFN